MFKIKSITLIIVSTFIVGILIGVFIGKNINSVDKTTDINVENTIEIAKTEQIKIVESDQEWEFVSDNPFNPYTYKIKIIDIKNDYIKFDVIGEKYTDSFHITTLNNKCWKLK